MSRRTTLWLGFAVILLHTLEEYVTMGAFLAAHRDAIPSPLRAMTGERFAVSLAIATLLFLVVTWAGVRSRPKGPSVVLAIALYGVMAVNALQHAAVASWAGGYAPGIVTGLALVLPFAIYLVRRALQEGWVAVKPLLFTAAVALLLAPLFLVGIHALSGVVR